MTDVGADAENPAWENRVVRAQPIARRDSFARNLVLVIGGMGILCLSFWVTLTVIDSNAEFRPGDVRLVDIPVTNEDGSPRSAHPSKVSDLPHPPLVPTYGTGWDGLEGLNALIMGPGPIGGGNLALSLVATSDSGRHRLGIAASVPANRPIHLVAWVKAPPGTRINIDVRDGAPSGQTPHNTGAATLALSPPTVLTSSGNVQTGIGAGPSNWVKIPVDMPSSNGACVIYFSLLGAGDATAFRGSGEQMIFGGIDLTLG